jgi:hypothetical protein
MAGNQTTLTWAFLELHSGCHPLSVDPPIQKQTSSGGWIERVGLCIRCPLLNGLLPRSHLSSGQSRRTLLSCVKFRSSRQLRSHHRSRCRGSERSFQCAGTPTKVAPHGGSQLADRSARTFAATAPITPTARDGASQTVAGTGLDTSNGKVFPLPTDGANLSCAGARLAHDQANRGMKVRTQLPAALMYRATRDEHGSPPVSMSPLSTTHCLS